MSRRQRTKVIKRKSIDLYTYVYNDEDILPYFLKYYSFVDSMTFIDSNSSDNTLDLIYDFASNSEVKIRVAQTGLNTWNHEVLHNYRNEIWKDSKADLVMFPDCDEFFYHPDIVTFLSENNCDVYEMEGYDMVSRSFPQNNIFDVKTGVRFQMYDKSTIFNPKVKISFPNAHLRYCASVNVNIGGIKLLHYRYLGIPMMQKRRDRERDRLPSGQKIREIFTNAQIKTKHEQLMRDATRAI